MSLFYKEEHTTCYHYTMLASANFQILHFNVSHLPQLIEVDRSVLIFLLSGEARVTCNNYRDRHQREGEMLLLPCNSCCYVKIIRECTIISCSFLPNVDFCSSFSFHDLARYIPENYSYDFPVLPVRERVAQCMTLLRQCLQDGVSCAHYHTLKERELFILLRAYYSKEELAVFFFPLLGKDVDFKDMVLMNYRSVRHINEFAELAHMSTDTFKRRFKDAFGEPVHKWMTQRKAELIYRDIVLGQKTFAEISIEHDMSSQAYLSTFCKRHFGDTPQNLRESSSFDTVLNLRT
ncbi:helix-turn-helix transcriptional regulator [Phocaeicola sartorii]|uniref:helix-turn-helix transcriptional regulator n=1 Tax=Phocaeicola sartorii TaxID=671267 RepID=UPI00351287D6